MVVVSLTAPTNPLKHSFPTCTVSSFINGTCKSFPTTVQQNKLLLDLSVHSFHASCKTVSLLKSIAKPLSFVKGRLGKLSPHCFQLRPLVVCLGAILLDNPKHWTMSLLFWANLNTIDHWSSSGGRKETCIKLLEGWGWGWVCFTIPRSWLSSVRFFHHFSDLLLKHNPRWRTHMKDLQKTMRYWLLHAATPASAVDTTCGGLLSFVFT